MRLLLAGFLLILFAACGKDKFTTEPQIEFKRFKPASASSNTIDIQNPPFVVFELRDADGDLGYKPNDTSYIYIKNVLVPDKMDSIVFPDLSRTSFKNIPVEVEVSIYSLIATPTRPRPHTDSIRFEIYVTDFAGNKSNVITTGPFIYTTE